MYLSLSLSIYIYIHMLHQCPPRCSLCHRAFPGCQATETARGPLTISNTQLGALHRFTRRGRFGSVRFHVPVPADSGMTWFGFGSVRPVRFGFSFLPAKRRALPGLPSSQGPKHHGGHAQSAGRWRVQDGARAKGGWAGWYFGLCKG